MYTDTRSPRPDQAHHGRPTLPRYDLLGHGDEVLELGDHVRALREVQVYFIAVG